MTDPRDRPPVPSGPAEAGEPADQVRARYERFATGEAAGSSASYEAWAHGVADDAPALDLLSGLDVSQQQPNLVFAAARWIGVEPADGYPALREAFRTRWRELTDVVRSRRTQTNEAGRCAVLLPLLAAIEGPVALLEVGASAGLCLYPDRYSYRYGDGTRLDPVEGPSPVTLHCDVRGSWRPPGRLPDVVWRAGIDVNPLDVEDDDAMRWLQTLVWPEHDTRRRTLVEAVRIARTDPPHLVRGDLNEQLRSVAALAPRDATLVVFHSAVLAYVHDLAERARFADTVRSLDAHWISNEGRGVLALPGLDDLPPTTPDTLFVLALDEQITALSRGHGTSVTWLP